MTAATQDIKTVSQDGKRSPYPVKAGARIFLDTMVCLDATGYAVPGSDTAGLKFVGVASCGADNRLGSDGDKEVIVEKMGEYDYASSGLARGNEGDPLYIVDDKTVGLSSVNSILAGKQSEYVSADIARVNILPVTGAIS
jgi:hypothetical protein